eukprot:434426-Amphidinium_carterae.2
MTRSNPDGPCTQTFKEGFHQAKALPPKRPRTKPSKCAVQSMALPIRPKGRNPMNFFKFLLLLQA